MNDADILNYISTIILKDTTICQTTLVNVQNMKFSNIYAPKCNVNFNNINQTIDYNNSYDCNEANPKVNVNATSFINYMNDYAISHGFNQLTDESYLHIVESLATEVSNINIESLNTCLISTINAQDFRLNNFEIHCNDGGELNINNISQKIKATVLSSCLQKNSNLVNYIREFSTFLDNNNISSTQPTTVPTTIPSSRPPAIDYTTIILIGVFTGVFFILAIIGFALKMYITATIVLILAIAGLITCILYAVNIVVL